MIDRVEAGRRGHQPAKTSTKHPYAAIEHRVIDSAAYANLTYAARALLVLITRQLTKDNNGHLQATFSYMRRFGFSENTLSRSIKELITHGMICRTRSGGYQQGAAQYAVTWLPIKDRQGLFMDGFVACAWRYWVPNEEKLPPPKLLDSPLKNGIWIGFATPNSEDGCPPKSEDNELVPCSSSEMVCMNGISHPRKHAPSLPTISNDWIPEYLKRLTLRGVAHACPVATFH